ncbi:pyridoxal phosphate-dependent decarboxylase family protein [Streptomyces sp. URMC 129]|uniref:pyridoxal phosphate-dependent decarboxylase family protein n=1 Tax=Streptomyces sp. URMC 129 TaxID=3423407 RepID=UPI003F19F31A
MERPLPDLDLDRAEGTTELAAWFMGPKGENVALFEDMIREAVRAHGALRREIYPDDPVHVTDEMKRSDAYEQSVKRMRYEFGRLLDHLRGSVPQFSYRHQGHMNAELTIPGLAGYFAAMLCNQNNVAAEGSPVTTLLEIAVGDDLCRLLGYPLPPAPGAPRPSGHIVCDGTVANLEALWAARNLTYYPIALARAVAHESALARARDIVVTDGTGRRHRLLGLTDWALVNLPMDAVLALPATLRDTYRIDERDLARITGYTIQELGYERFHRDLLDQPLGPPAVLAPSTTHYSWPKAASILGIGQDNILTVQVDRDARARLGHREELLRRCRKERRPVVMDVVVLGSTELSAVDPLAATLDLRDAHARNGFCYPVHVDAAWGGYFAALRRDRGPLPGDPYLRATMTPGLMMSAYVNRQYDALPGADSITVDPHKAGYVPYPAGGLCYRNEKQRDMVASEASYVFRGPSDISVGRHGVEGSKPGAAAAGVYLSHRVIRGDRTGYGRILGQSLFNSKRLYAGIVTMNRPAAPAAGPAPAPAYEVVPVQWLPAEKNGGDLRAQLDFIRDRVVRRSNRELVADEEAMRLFAELGSDQIVIGYAFNPYVDGRLNRDVALANAVNQEIHDRLSIVPAREPAGAAGDRAAPPFAPGMPPMILMGSVFDPAVYGDEFVRGLARRMGLDVPGATAPGGLPALRYLISTTMNPWMSDTAAGDFTPELIRILDATARAAIGHVLARRADPAA